MKVSDVIHSASEHDQPVFSFEFFPPKTEEGVRQLFRTVEALRPLDPAFVSMTYGAGGSARDSSIALISKIKRETAVEAVAHVTCIGASRTEIAVILDKLMEAEIENVLALRGDPPRGEQDFSPHPDGLRHANELVSLIRNDAKRWPVSIGAAAYPEGHSEAADRAADLANLKVKVDSGVDYLVTQLFFDNSLYVRFVEKARAAGIRVPIIPGIMPFTNVEQIERFTMRCGASIPSSLRSAMEDRRNDHDAALQLGVAYATLQCADLLRHGAPGIHFYTLNRSPATRAILAALRATRPWRKS